MHFNGFFPIIGMKMAKNELLTSTNVLSFVPVGMIKVFRLDIDFGVVCIKYMYLVSH